MAIEAALRPVQTASAERDKAVPRSELDESSVRFADLVRQRQEAGSDQKDSALDFDSDLDTRRDRQDAREQRLLDRDAEAKRDDLRRNYDRQDPRDDDVRADKARANDIDDEDHDSDERLVAQRDAEARARSSQPAGVLGAAAVGPSAIHQGAVNGLPQAGQTVPGSKSSHTGGPSGFEGSSARADNETQVPTGGVGGNQPRAGGRDGIGWTESLHSQWGASGPKSAAVGADPQAAVGPETVPGKKGGASGLAGGDSFQTHLKSHPAESDQQLKPGSLRYRASAMLSGSVNSGTQAVDGPMAQGAEKSTAGAEQFAGLNADAITKKQGSGGIMETTDPRILAANPAMRSNEGDANRSAGAEALRAALKRAGLEAGTIRSSSGVETGSSGSGGGTSGSGSGFTGSTGGTGSGSSAGLSSSSGVEASTFTRSLASSQSPSGPTGPFAGPTGTPSPASQVAVFLGRQDGKGLQNVRINLNPAELGQVEARLTIRNGEVRAQITVETAKALEALTRDRHVIEHALERSGLKLEQGGVTLALAEKGSESAFTSDGGATPDRAGQNPDHGGSQSGGQTFDEAVSDGRGSSGRHGRPGGEEAPRAGDGRTDDDGSAILIDEVRRVTTDPNARVDVTV